MRVAQQKQALSGIWGWVGLVVGLASLYTPSVLAEKKQVEAFERKAVEASIARFKEFMQDKNIQTSPRGPDGKPIEGKSKLTANPDDKNPFESDLTYHDRSFNKLIVVKDPSKPNDPKATKIEIEKQFTSSHGKLSAAGGSSSLERKAYEVDQRFTEQDKKEQKKPEEGFRFDGMFEVETKEVKAKDIQQGIGPDGKPLPPPPKEEGESEEEDDVITISRRKIRDEGVREFQEVGKNAAGTVIESARDPEKKQDPNALANGVLLRVAAAENLMALWRSTLANLTQRRANKAIAPLIGDDGKVGRIEMEEETPNCDVWASRAREKIADIPEEKRKTVQKDLEQMTSQCKQIASMPYNVVNPRYVPNKDLKYELKLEGPETEDSIERDSRVQLEIMAKAGKSATDVQSNWKFDTAEDKVKLNRYQADGSTEEIETTAAEEIESYNSQLRSAKEGYEQAAKSLGNFQPPDPTQFEIQVGDRSMMEVSQAPSSAMEEFGIDGPGSLTEAPPQSYQQLQGPNE